MDLIKPALQVLKYFYENPAKNLRLLLGSRLEAIEAVDSAGVTRTVYGVVRKELQLRQVIEKYSRRSYETIDLDVLILLKIGIYLLFFSRSYPDYGVVNEIVNHASRGAKNFLNANLRSILRNRDQIELMLTNFSSIPIKYSISEYLIEYLENIIPASQMETTLHYLNQEPRFHVRVNTRDFDYDRVRDVLSELKVNFRDIREFDSFEVKSISPAVKNLLDQGCLYVQNTSSQIVATIAAAFSREPVLDCCAAPGTKSVTLSLLRPELRVFASDINLMRMKTFQQFTRSLDMKNIHLCVSDSRLLGFKGGFQFILADVPCSSAGTLRKNPDLKLKINEEVVERNSTVQFEIMESLLPFMRKGGYILYAICSFIEDEADKVIDKVDASAPIDGIDISDILSEYGFRFKAGRWGYYLLPNPLLNNDLFYISLFKVL